MINAISYKVGVDIGGTFTDIVLLGSDGSIHTKKISSSTDNYASAIVNGLTDVFAETALSGTNWHPLSSQLFKIGFSGCQEPRPGPAGRPTERICPRGRFAGCDQGDVRRRSNQRDRG